MDPKLKRDSWIAGIGVAAAALCLPAMFVGMVHLPADFNLAFAPLVLLHVYVFICLFNLVWGSVQVIWELPCKERRVFLFLLWLILYPVLCVGWYYLCGMGLFFICHFH